MLGARHGAHNHVFNAHRGITEPGDGLAIEAREEERAYLTTLRWMEGVESLKAQLGLPPADMAMQTFVTRHIKEGNYTGLMAKFVTGDDTWRDYLDPLFMIEGQLAEEFFGKVNATQNFNKIDFLNASFFEDSRGPGLFLEFTVHGSPFYRTYYNGIAPGQPISSDNIDNRSVHLQGRSA